mmetsp:Transcript_29016/g.48759  ORF Transcript_29016/g.48759 Transcript_29016/m.48759 type:complete len:82 (+) Transcript_29016:955-1200(+)
MQEVYGPLEECFVLSSPQQSPDQQQRQSSMTMLALSVVMVAAAAAAAASVPTISSLSYFSLTIAINTCMVRFHISIPSCGH